MSTSIEIVNHRISYCADDKAEKRFFSFIAKEAEEEKHTCFVFVSDKLVRNWPKFALFRLSNSKLPFQAEEITLTIGQAFDLAYKRFLSGKAAESESEKIARLERENCELRQRLVDLGALLAPGKLAEFLEKNNIKDLAAVGDSGGDGDHEEQVVKDQTGGSPNEEAEQPSSAVPDSKLISFDSITATGLDTMTLDDLNDDDFDPRAFDQGNSGDSSDASDDFNPRGSTAQAVPVIKPAETVSQVRIDEKMSLEQAFQITSNQAPAAVPARLAPPPTLAPRDPSKVSGKPISSPSTNPFSAPPPSTAAPVLNLGPKSAASDPFGMSSFAAGGPNKVRSSIFEGSNIF